MASQLEEADWASLMYHARIFTCAQVKLGPSFLSVISTNKLSWNHLQPTSGMMEQAEGEGYERVLFLVLAFLSGVFQKRERVKHVAFDLQLLEISQYVNIFGKAKSLASVNCQLTICTSWGCYPHIVYSFCFQIFLWLREATATEYASWRKGKNDGQWTKGYNKHSYNNYSKVTCNLLSR